MTFFSWRYPLSVNHIFQVPSVGAVSLFVSPHTSLEMIWFFTHKQPLPGHTCWILLIPIYDKRWMLYLLWGTKGQKQEKQPHTNANNLPLCCVQGLPFKTVCSALLPTYSQLPSAMCLLLCVVSAQTFWWRSAAVPRSLPAFISMALPALIANNLKKKGR